MGRAVLSIDEAYLADEAVREIMIRVGWFRSGHYQNHRMGASAALELAVRQIVEQALEARRDG
jgi:hypothetical protein